MKTNFTKENNTLFVDIEGRLDATNAPEFESLLGKNTSDVGAVTINCEKLDYISSAGLRVLLTVHKKMKGCVKLTNVQELVMEVLELTGFVDILEIA